MNYFYLFWLRFRTFRAGFQTWPKTPFIVVYDEFTTLNGCHPVFLASISCSLRLESEKWALVLKWTGKVLPLLRKWASSLNRLVNKCDVICYPIQREKQPSGIFTKCEWVGFREASESVAKNNFDSFNTPVCVNAQRQRKWVPTWIGLSTVIWAHTHTHSVREPPNRQICCVSVSVTNDHSSV